MPTKHASIKDLRKSAKCHARNLRIQTHVKHAFKEAKDLVTKGDFEGAKKAAVRLQQIVDKAAKTHAVSKNATRRKKAKIMKAIAKGGEK